MTRRENTTHPYYKVIWTNVLKSAVEKEVSITLLQRVTYRCQGCQSTTDHGAIIQLHMDLSSGCYFSNGARALIFNLHQSTQPRSGVYTTYQCQDGQYGGLISRA